MHIHICKHTTHTHTHIFPGSSLVKNLPANAGDTVLIHGSGKFPGEGNGNLLQYFCLKTSHGWRSLAGYSPCGHTELGTT